MDLTRRAEALGWSFALPIVGNVLFPGVGGLIGGALGGAEAAGIEGGATVYCPRKLGRLV